MIRLRSVALALAISSSVPLSASLPAARSTSHPTAPAATGPAPWQTFALDSAETVVDLVVVARVPYLITSARVIDLAHDRPLVLAKACPILDASALGTQLVLAKACGTERIDLPTGHATAVPGMDFPADQVCLDFTGLVWARHRATGMVWCYDPSDRSLREMPRAGDPHDIAATPDASTWFATSIGLVQLRQALTPFGKTGSMSGKAGWYFHEEEARRGFELADNYVDRLWGHGQTILWVQLDASLTYVDLATATAAGGHGHMPSLSTIGERGNAVRDIRYLPGHDYAVMATDLGLLALSRFELDKISVSAHTKSGQEIFGAPLSTGLLPLDIRSSVEVPAEAHFRGVRDDGRGGVYVFGDGGYARVKRRALAKLLPQPDPAEYERFRQQQHVHFVTAQ